jgi:hypothetical protein
MLLKKLTFAQLPQKPSPRLFYKVKINYRVHKIQSLDPIPSQVKPIHSLRSYFLRIFTNTLKFTPRSFLMAVHFGSLSKTLLTLAATNRVLCAIQCCHLCHAFTKSAHVF